MRGHRLVVLLAHAIALWALCGATMGVALRVTSLERALVIHALAAPVLAAALSSLYFTRFGYTTPLVTACWIVAVVVTLDFFVVALAVNRSLDMFRSFTGTWLPLALIFAATLATGRSIEAAARRRVEER